MNVLLLGPQGSGKGTQAKRIADEYGVPHISTGEMFRALDESTELGREVNEHMARGELVPDELTIRLIRERLAEDDAREGFVLDGFPRNFAQAEALDALLAEIGRDLDVVLYFQLDDETAMNRVKGRSKEESRSDDTTEALQRRLDIYHQETEPLAEYYRAKDILVPLRADRSIDQVWAEVQDALERVAVR